MADSNSVSCVVSQDSINIRCLQCGAISSGNIFAIGECPCCGALDYHLFKGYVALDEPPRNRRACSPDNRDVINKLIELVQNKTR